VPCLDRDAGDNGEANQLVVDDIEGDIAVGVFGHLFGFEAQ
jgi:hypothetical protein